MLERATSSEPSATFHFMFLRSLARFCSSLSINFTHCRQEVYSERSRAKEAAPQRTQSYMLKVTPSVMSFDTRREIWKYILGAYKKPFQEIKGRMPLKESNI